MLAAFIQQQLELRQDTTGQWWVKRFAQPDLRFSTQSSSSPIPHMCLAFLSLIVNFFCVQAVSCIFFSTFFIASLVFVVLSHTPKMSVSKDHQAI